MESKLLLVAALAVLGQTGLSSYVPAPRGTIVGGEEAADGEFPWQVSLRQIGMIGATHFCGGTVLNENWVVTAAHCCAGQIPLLMHVVAGGIKLNNAEGEEERRDIEKIIGHPEYSSKLLTNDICLLKLKKPLVMTEFIKPIALPESMEEYDAGTKAIVTGWGTMSEGALILPNVLHKVTVPIISDAECGDDYSMNGIDIAPSMVCAGLPKGGKDSCQGDSGGPFIHAEQKTLVGVVSWGIGCGREGYPGVYTQVSHFIDWIEETMA